MKKYNNFLLTMILSGIIAIIIGSLQKLNGNSNYHYALSAGLLIELFATVCFLFYNFQLIKKFNKIIFDK